MRGPTAPLVSLRRPPGIFWISREGRPILISLSRPGADPLPSLPPVSKPFCESLSMSIVFEKDPHRALHELSEAAKSAVLGARGAPQLILLNESLDPECQDDPVAPAERAAFQAHFDPKGLFPILRLAPPSELARALTDWSSSEALEKAQRAFQRCLIAYERALSPALGEEAIKKASDLINEALSKRFEAARCILESCEQEPSQSAQETFNRWRELVGQAPDLAEMSALRGALSSFEPQEARALMARSDIAFSAAAELEETLRTRPPIPGCSGLYKAVQNGSFRSSLKAATDDPSEMARLFLRPDFSLGPEHAFHNHFLICPDGELHGADRFPEWAKKTLRMAEVFELSRVSARGLSAPSARAL